MKGSVKMSDYINGELYRTIAVFDGSDAFIVEQYTECKIGYKCLGVVFRGTFPECVSYLAAYRAAL